MVKISSQKIRHFLEAARNGKSEFAKGKALEDLACYLFARIPGISVAMRNPLTPFNTEEIDVAFWNERVRSGLLFLPDIILVECKNWAKPVSSKEVASFDTKLRNRGLLMGILVASHGITGDPIDLSDAHNVIASALKEQRRIIVITEREILSFHSTDQIVLCFKEKYCQLAVAGRVFSK